jgi:hypothetical protein
LGREHAREANWDFGLVPYMTEEDFAEADDEEFEPYPGLESEQDRTAYVTRQRLIEHRGIADGITLQEIAQRLLDQQGWSYVEYEITFLLSVVGADLKNGSPKYDAAASISSGALQSTNSPIGSRRCGKPSPRLQRFRQRKQQLQPSTQPRPRQLLCHRHRAREGASNL